MKNLSITIILMILSSSILFAQSNTDIDPNAKINPHVTTFTDDLFDHQFDFICGDASGEAGIETNGSYIYSSKWNGEGFFCYEMDGTFVGWFPVAGEAAVRDLAFDGTFFYGAAANTSLFEMDFTGQSGVLISTLTAAVATRACAYDTDYDGFWGNNWSDPITLYDRSGGIINQFNCGQYSSYYGFAYMSYFSGDPWLYGFAQSGGASQAVIVQIDPYTGAETGVTFDAIEYSTTGTGIAGGLAEFFGIVPGRGSLIGIIQNETIFGVESSFSSPYSNDLKLTKIVEPNTGFDLGFEEIVLKVENFGLQTQSNFDVKYRIDGGTWVTETIAGPLTFGEYITYSFNQTYDFSAFGEYFIEAEVILEGDENPLNNSKVKTIENFDPLQWCNYSITMWDDYGDGWNGGFVQIFGDGVEFINATLASGAGPETIEFLVQDGSFLTAVWTAGGWPYECSYIIFDTYGNNIFEDGMGGVDPTGGDIGYASCGSHIQVIEYSPASFIQSVPINGNAQDFLNIYSEGCGTLEWNIEVVFPEDFDSVNRLGSKEIWLIVDPIEGILASGASEIVTLDFNAEEMEEGIYYAEIIIFSNCFYNPEVIIPVTMIVGTPLQYFVFEGGDPADPVWTINLASGKLNDFELQPLDEIAVFDGDLMVGAFLLDEVLTMENALNNSLIAFSTLNSQQGYQPGNPYSFKCWDASDEIEIEYFDINLLNPYRDAYMGDVFPSGNDEYSIAELNFLTPIIQSFNLTEGYQFVSLNLETIDPDMTEVLSEILNDNLDFVRNTEGQTLRKIGNIWVNGIGDWIIEEGYLIRMFNEDSFTIEGLFIDPETAISLVEGYQLVSYLPSATTDALIAFQSIIGDNLDFIRNSQGYTLRKIGPIWINGIGNCIPGEGYLVKMFSDDELVFSIFPPCGEPIIDVRDQQIYNTVEIGGQCWFAENLNIGSMINGSTNQTNNSVIEKYCYDNDPANCEIYGGLYQWDEMMQYSTNNQGICPDEWHLPSDAEWFTLENYIDPNINNPNLTGWRGTDCGLKMLEGGSSGFEGLLSGYKDWDSPEFLMMGERTYFRSTTIYSSPYSWYRALENNNLQVYRNSATKTYGFSVRCLRDEITKQFPEQSLKSSKEEYRTNQHLNKKTSMIPNHFVVKEGNPQDPVWTIYFEKGSLNIGDEIGVFDGEILTGAGRVISDNILENAVPVFSNLYKTGNKPIIKAWIKNENKEYILQDYTFSNPYGDAWIENVFPSEDGEYSLLNFSITGLSDENVINDISIYPNPSTGIITIGNLTAFENLSTLEITDITGKIVFKLSINHQQSSIELDLSELKNGVYFISFSGKDFNRVEKIVIQ